MELRWLFALWTSSLALTFSAVFKGNNRVADFSNNISIVFLQVSIIWNRQHNIMHYIHSRKKVSRSKALLIILHPPPNSM